MEKNQNRNNRKNRNETEKKEKLNYLLLGRGPGSQPHLRGDVRPGVGAALVGL
jgi:hypothetical protein